MSCSEAGWLWGRSHYPIDSHCNYSSNHTPVDRWNWLKLSHIFHLHLLPALLQTDMLLMCIQPKPLVQYVEAVFFFSSFAVLPSLHRQTHPQLHPVESVHSSARLCCHSLSTLHFGHCSSCYSLDTSADNQSLWERWNMHGYPWRADKAEQLAT